MTERFFPDNFPAPDEYLLELGRITALWGSLESSIDLAISKLSGFGESSNWRFHVLIAHSNFKQRVDILETLCHGLQDDHPHLKKYKQTIKLIIQVQSKRNYYLHNGVFLNEENGKVYTSNLSARGKLKTDIKEVSVKDLRTVSENIHLTLLSIHELITQVKYNPVWER